MANSTQRNTMTVGSLALDGKARLRVIEGGQDSSRKAAAASPRSSAPIALCVATMIVAVCLAWLQIDHMTSVRVARAFAEAPVETVTVMPGDSLWQIAEEHPVQGTTTDQLVNHIIDENGLEDAMLRPGMRISVPAESSSC